MVMAPNVNVACHRNGPASSCGLGPGDSLSPLCAAESLLNTKPLHVTMLLITHPRKFSILPLPPLLVLVEPYYPHSHEKSHQAASVAFLPA
jgi:hypothetical protein